MKKTFSKGFTLIELLVVIAIIGILSSVVLTSLSSAKGKANRAATLADLRGVMPELVTCADDAGYARTDTNNATVVCATAANGGTLVTGHTAGWPSLPTGSAYVAPTGTLSGNTYVYTATVSGQNSITCTFSTGVCN